METKFSKSPKKFMCIPSSYGDFLLYNVLDEYDIYKAIFKFNSYFIVSISTNMSQKLIYFSNNSQQSNN